MARTLKSLEIELSPYNYLILMETSDDKIILIHSINTEIISSIKLTLRQALQLRDNLLALNNRIVTSKPRVEKK